MDRAILVFSKFPTPGAVNTRMVPPLTPEEAAELHMTSLLAVVDTARAVDHADVILLVTPDERTDDLGVLCGNRPSQCRPQGNGNLGQRLAGATERAFATGARRALVLGTDSPTLNVDTLATAFAMLDRHDAVLGPCDDGGYYLLGLRRPLPALFERIDWGGGEVAAQTRERAVTGNIDLAELPRGYDLDRIADLHRALRDLNEVAAPTASKSALRELLEMYTRRYAPWTTSPR